MPKLATWMACGAMVCLWLTGCGGGGGSEGPSLSEQVKAAMSSSTPEVRVTKLVAVAAKQQQAGDVNGASASIAAAAESAKTVEKPANRVRALCQVVTALKGGGESKALLKAASNAADEVTESREKAAAVARLAVAYGQAMKDPDIAKLHLKNATDEANKIELPEDKASALLELAAAEATLENADNALALVNSALEVARTVTNGRAKAESLASAGVTLNKLKKPDESKAAFDEATVEAGKLTDPMEQSYAYLEVATRLITAGDKKTAAGLLEKAEKISAKVDASIKGSLEDGINKAKARAAS